MRDPVQLLIDERDQLFISLQIALAPIEQQPGYFLGDVSFASHRQFKMYRSDSNIFRVNNSAQSHRFDLDILNHTFAAARYRRRWLLPCPS